MVHRSPDGPQIERGGQCKCSHESQIGDVGGATFNPYFILISVDPNFALDHQKLEATLVHEYHHAIRWRVSDFGADLAQLLVSEGLAVLFEEECIGEAPFYSDADITDQEVAIANIDLHAQPFNQQK